MSTFAGWRQHGRKVSLSCSHEPRVLPSREPSGWSQTSRPEPAVAPPPWQTAWGSLTFVSGLHSTMARLEVPDWAAKGGLPPPAAPGTSLGKCILETRGCLRLNTCAVHLQQEGPALNSNPKLRRSGGSVHCVDGGGALLVLFVCGRSIKRPVTLRWAHGHG